MNRWQSGVKYEGSKNDTHSKGSWVLGRCFTRPCTSTYYLYVETIQWHLIIPLAKDLLLILFIILLAISQDQTQTQTQIRDEHHINNCTAFLHGPVWDAEGRGSRIGLHVWWYYTCKVICKYVVHRKRTDRFYTNSTIHPWLRTTGQDRWVGKHSTRDWNPGQDVESETASLSSQKSTSFPFPRMECDRIGWMGAWKWSSVHFTNKWGIYTQYCSCWRLEAELRRWRSFSISLSTVTETRHLRVSRYILL